MKHRCRLATKSVNRRGFTLAEVLVATAILGLVIAAALQVVGVAGATARVARDEVAGVNVAEHLLSDIMMRRYAESAWDNPIGPDLGEGDGLLQPYDDVDDYNGYTGQPNTFFSGSNLHKKTPTWTYRVSVVWVATEPPFAQSATPTRGKRIDVEVRFFGRTVTTLSGYRFAGVDELLEPHDGTSTIPILGDLPINLDL